MTVKTITKCHNSEMENKITFSFQSVNWHYGWLRNPPYKGKIHTTDICRSKGVMCPWEARPCLTLRNAGTRCKGIGDRDWMNRLLSAVQLTVTALTYWTWSSSPVLWLSLKGLHSASSAKDLCYPWQHHPTAVITKISEEHNLSWQKASSQE